MADKFVLAVHTKTHVLQRVPEHYIETFPYFELATKAQLKEAQSPTPKADKANKTKEGAK